MTEKPKPRPGEVLVYDEKVCANCGLPFRVLWTQRRRRLCRACRQGQ